MNVIDWFLIVILCFGAFYLFADYMKDKIYKKNLQEEYDTSEYTDITKKFTEK